MAKPRDPRRDEAFEIWKASGGQIDLVEIAAQLDVSAGTVRGWKSKDKWEAQLNGTFQSIERSAPLNNTERSKRIGAPKGNRNAVGNKGGAPKGNQNAKGNRGGKGGPYGNKKAVSTGEYESIWFDTLTDDEKELLNTIDTDPIQQAEEEIQLWSIRQLRMLQRIKKLNDGLTEKERNVLYELRTTKDVAIVHDEKSGQTKKVPVSRDEMVKSRVEVSTFRKLDDILKLEEALTRVQDKKLKAIELKNRLMDEEKEIRIEKLRFELQMLRGGDGDNVTDDGFIEALRGKAAEVWADGKAET